MWANAFQHGDPNSFPQKLAVPVQSATLHRRKYQEVVRLRSLACGGCMAPGKVAVTVEGKEELVSNFDALFKFNPAWKFGPSRGQKDAIMYLAWHNEVNMLKFGPGSCWGRTEQQIIDYAASMAKGAKAQAKRDKANAAAAGVGSTPASNPRGAKVARKGGLVDDVCIGMRLTEVQSQNNKLTTCPQAQVVPPREASPRPPRPARARGCS
jgi:hypothetical protein